MGVNPSVVEWEDVFRMLHGTKSGKKRTHGTGVRHFVANKAHINEQESLLDKTDPQLLLLPILSREECLEWNGEDYDAIVLVGTNKNRKSYLWALEAVGMKKPAKMKATEATKKELACALELMRQMTYALVQSLVNWEPPEVSPTATGDAIQDIMDGIKKRKDRISEFNNLMRNQRVRVPKRKGCFPIDSYALRGVCKVSFSNDKAKGLHRTPDPLLLVARTAVVFSVRQSFRLRASAIAQDNYDWKQDTTQFEHLEEIARRRGLNKATDGMEIEARMSAPGDGSDSMSTMSLESNTSSVSDPSAQVGGRANLLEIPPSSFHPIENVI